MEFKEIIEELFMERAAVNEVCHSIAADDTTKRELLGKLELNARKLIERNFDMLTELSLRQVDGGEIDDIFSNDMPEGGEYTYEADDDDSDIIEQMMSLEQ